MLTGIDPRTGTWCPFFIRGAIDGPTTLSSKACASVAFAAGRATVQVLNMNDARRLELRTEVLRHDELA